MHLLAVNILRHRQDARRHAALDLILQARPAAIAKIMISAIAQEKMLFDNIDGFACRHGRRERTEIAPAVLDDLAGGQYARPGMLRGYFDAQITLIVLEPDVVARLVDRKSTRLNSS